MIERIMWPTPRGSRERPSPFPPGEHERPLRITFHEARLAGLLRPEREALDAVRQLAYRPGIEALTMAADQFVSLTDTDRVRVVGDFGGGRYPFSYHSRLPRHRTQEQECGMGMDR